jgi:hypothetical protein
MLRTALTLASRGMHVFPCVPRRKEPACEHGLRDDTIDHGIIRQWWHCEPHYNVAIATGTISKIFAIDIDGLDAEAGLRRLEAEHSALPPTVEVITGRGRHLYFEMPESTVRNSTGKIAPGVDVRGDGGYVIVPPSIHPSGRAYAWSVDSAKTFATAPDWLLARIAEHTGGESKSPTPPSEWRELAANGVSEGQRNCSIAKLAGHLLRRRVDPPVVLALMQTFNATRCTPPLSESDITRIVDSIAGKELKRRREANGR